MLTEERQGELLKIVDAQGAVTVQKIARKLAISESTVRRDLVILHRQGKLNKVHGGATSLVHSHIPYEDRLQDKYALNMAEKRKIAKYAAALIKQNDFVFLDAGSTTEQMAGFITQTNAVFVTNGIPLARKLAHNGFTTFLISGRIKGTTEAIIGNEAVEALKRYHFTIGFFGANGITVNEGFTTPDMEEARNKTAALQQCQRRFVLADSSKLGVLSHITFAGLAEANIITVKNKTIDQYSEYEEITGVHLL